jgi:hypothetical protein
VLLLLTACAVGWVVLFLQAWWLLCGAPAVATGMRTWVHSCQVLTLFLLLIAIGWLLLLLLLLLLRLLLLLLLFT